MAGQQSPGAPGGGSLLQQGNVALFLKKYSDVALAGVVVVIIGMMIIPLPTFILDLFIVANMAAAVVMLLVAIYITEALRIATFPTLLLITTLFRLAIEVSATRLILLHADGGEVIHAFGNFVVAGNLVVGAVIFFILTMIQFIVIAKGSERVAEVGARFTLDAMPGKQMSIDAELRAGHIDHTEARRRRAALSRESQFFGSMDGAMKFVKGDAIAGIIVLVTNIVGGLIIGIVQRGMDAGVAARTYTVLTIGEGLVSQIPALVISTAAGIIVTRVASEEEGGHLGKDIVGQLTGQPKALAIAAALMLLLALVPGFPAIPFMVLAGVIGFISWQLMGDEKAAALAKAAGARPGAPAAAAAAKDAAAAGAAAAGAKGGPAGAPAVPSPTLTPIGIDLSPILGELFSPDGSGGRFVKEMVPALRERVFNEMGIQLPAVRLRPGVQALAPHGYAIRIHEVTMGRGTVKPDFILAAATPDQLADLGFEGEAAPLPEGGKGAWLPASELERVRAAGVMANSSEEVVARHLFHLVRRYGYEFLGIQETQGLLEGLERSHPALVREVVPKLVSPVVLTDVLKRLAEEGVSLRSMREILGALAEWAPLERDPVALTEHVRGALRRQIVSKYVGPSGALVVYLLDPMIEETIRESIQRTPTGSYLALEPAISRDIIAAVNKTLAGGGSPVILTSSEIRRYVRRLLEAEHPDLAVLSFQELTSETKLQPLGRIKVA
jgi:type III secretion protein V